MKSIKAFFLTLWIYATLIWLYCVARIIINNIDSNDPFIIGIPISFLELSLVAFLVSTISCYMYVVQE